MNGSRRRRGRTALPLFLALLLPLALRAQEPTAPPAGERTPDLADELLHRLDQVDPAAPGEAAGEISPRRRWTLTGLLAAATMVSEDLTCLAGGLLVARHKLSYFAATSACFVGIFLGDLALVFVGRWLGRGALERWPLRRMVRRDTLERSERYFRDRGARVVFLSRFVPGSRLPLFLAAGILRAPIAPIAGALALAGIVWTPLLVGLSAWTGGAILGLFARFERFALVGLAAAALVAWLVLRLVVPMFSWRGRRMLLSRWRRISRWEFWPAWLFELPVFLYVVRLGLRHGGIGTFAAANPGIPAGGFVEESKSAILGALQGAPIARFVLLDADRPREELLRDAREAMAAEPFHFPVVLKPDVGERGTGVRIARSERDLATVLAAARGKWLLQEYVEGEEYGLFYVRRPDEERGRIISITTKRFPVVTGDGERTLGDLILADDRAVCMAPWYLERNAHRIEVVPAAGERVQLVEIGNHCLGALFLDGDALRTPALEQAIDAIAKQFSGFHFGRFDLRTASEATLRAGEGLRILELNGVTSEATHIYAPGASLLRGWRTLFAQWRTAFEIGEANIARGARRTTAGELLALLRARRQRQRERSRSASIPEIPLESRSS